MTAKISILFWNCSPQDCLGGSVGQRHRSLARLLLSMSGGALFYQPDLSPAWQIYPLPGCSLACPAASLSARLALSPVQRLPPLSDCFFVCPIALFLARSPPSSCRPLFPLPSTLSFAAHSFPCRSLLPLPSITPPCRPLPSLAVHSSLCRSLLPLPLTPSLVFHSSPYRSLPPLSGGLGEKCSTWNIYRRFPKHHTNTSPPQGFLKVFSGLLC